MMYNLLLEHAPPVQTAFLVFSLARVYTSTKINGLFVVHPKQVKEMSLLWGMSHRFPAILREVEANWCSALRPNSKPFSNFKCKWFVSLIEIVWCSECPNVRIRCPTFNKRPKSACRPTIFIPRTLIYPMWFSRDVQFVLEAAHVAWLLVSEPLWLSRNVLVTLLSVRVSTPGGNIWNRNDQIYLLGRSFLLTPNLPSRNLPRHVPLMSCSIEEEGAIQWKVLRSGVPFV